MSFSTESHSYVIQEQIIRTKYYIIYRAKNMLTGNLCMIKAIEPKWLSNTEVKTELRNQALISSELKHPNICAVNTIFEEDNSLYVVWEYVEGQSLSTLLANQSFSVNQALDYCNQILQALSYAHSLGIIHKQLNPDSILLANDGTIKLIGFGKSNSAWMKVERDNTFLHPIYYIAPEIYHGEAGSPKSDLYSLGVIFYMMITKRLPWNMDYKQSFLQQKQQTFLKPVLDPELFGDRVPQWLYSILNRSLMMEPSLRMSTSQEMMSALETEEQYLYIPVTKNAVKDNTVVEVDEPDPLPEPPVVLPDPIEIEPEVVQPIETEPEPVIEVVEPELIATADIVAEPEPVEETFIEPEISQPVECPKAEPLVEEPIPAVETIVETIDPAPVVEPQPELEPIKTAIPQPTVPTPEPPKPVNAPEVTEQKQQPNPPVQNPPVPPKKNEPHTNLYQSTPYQSTPQNDDIDEISHMKKLFRVMAYLSLAIIIFVVVKYFVINRVPKFQSVQNEVKEIPKEAPPAEINVPLNMISVAGDSTVIGSMAPDADPDEFPLRQVVIRPFSISRTEITQRQWQMVNSQNPSRFPDDNNPVENVSFYDVIDYCNAKSILDGFTPCYDYEGDEITCDFNANGYRLPTEAEWEFAAKARKKAYFSIYSGSDIPDEVGWYLSNSDASSHVVAGLKANELGVYDMSGNVSEWVWDWYARYSYKVNDVFSGPDKGSDKVIRGGSWYSDAHEMRVTNRQYAKPFTKANYIGFRVVRSMY